MLVNISLEISTVWKREPAKIGSIYKVQRHNIKLHQVSGISRFWILQFFYKIIYKFSIHFSRGSFTKRIFAYFEGHLSHSRQQQKLFSLSQEIKKGKYGPNSFLIIFKMGKKADFWKGFYKKSKLVSQRIGLVDAWQELPPLRVKTSTLNFWDRF